MFSMKKGLVFLLTTFIFTSLLVVGMHVKHKSTFIDITFNYMNLDSLTIYDSENTSGDGNMTKVSELDNPGTKLQLEKNHQYKVTYIGAEGFKNGETVVNTTTKDSVVMIDPGYSDERLESILQLELPNIQRAFNDKYGKYSLPYILQTGKVFKKGDWYGSTLVYTGNDPFSDDTLRVILHRNNGEWEVATTPPDITLSKYIYPGIPDDVLREVNKLP